MKVWIHIDGVQEGPFEETHLPLDRMTPDTPVWYEGLPDWLPAARARVTAQYFTGQKGTPGVDPDTEAARRAYEALEGRKTERTAPSANTVAEAYSAPAAAVQAAPLQASPAAVPAAESPAKKPASYIIFSVILTIFTFNIFAILAVLSGAVVIWKNKNGNFATAARFSEFTAWMLMIAIVFILMSPVLALAIP